MMDERRLIEDEEEAIAGYEEALRGEDDPSVIAVYRSIIADERRHIQMIRKVEEGKADRAMTLFGLKPDKSRD